MATPKTILIIGDHGTRPPEPIANETLKPGHLLKYIGLHTDLATMKVGLQQSAGGAVYPLFALEADYVGTSGSATPRIDNQYASGDRVNAYVAERGAVIYAWLAAGNVVTSGMQLTAAANGELKISPNPGQFVAREAVTTVASAARIQVEVM